ncbi:MULTISPECIES: hypothetical protein [Xanthomonas]|uniref:hypothetical protein n=1 Tax=Xanthomonas TaxID=338 RepID=UPI00188377B0|nr:MULTISPECIES: hypothetical protein [Xanthomonas]QOX05508.1 hypothetical protein IG630_23775 [Xanthomonas sp. WG16]QXF04505.1 hypothetical protein KJA71_22680 [Xanthomonas citri pv. citri]
MQSPTSVARAGCAGVHLVRCSIDVDVGGQMLAAARPLVLLLVVRWISGGGAACLPVTTLGRTE